jgi:CBS domain-containing protein
MKTVKDILRSKNSGMSSITPDATVFAALKEMAAKNIGSLLVMDGGNLVGLITERDYSRKVILEGKSSGNTLVREIMTQQLLVVQPHTTIEECMALMIGNSVRYLPVIDDGQVVGMISMGNVVNTIISDQHLTIDNLQKYIMHG